MIVLLWWWWSRGSLSHSLWSVATKNKYYVGISTDKLKYYVLKAMQQIAHQIHKLNRKRIRRTESGQEDQTIRITHRGFPWWSPLSENILLYMNIFTRQYSHTFRILITTMKRGSNGASGQVSVRRPSPGRYYKTYWMMITEPKSEWGGENKS